MPTLKRIVIACTFKNPNKSWLINVTEGSDFEWRFVKNFEFLSMAVSQ